MKTNCLPKRYVGNFATPFTIDSVSLSKFEYADCVTVNIFDINGMVFIIVLCYSVVIQAFTRQLHKTYVLERMVYFRLVT